MEQEFFSKANMIQSNTPTLGSKISKYFKGLGWFDGYVAEIWKDDDGTTNFHILYDDEDEEDLNRRDVIRGMKKYLKHSKLITAKRKSSQKNGKSQHKSQKQCDKTTKCDTTLTVPSPSEPPLVHLNSESQETQINSILESYVPATNDLKIV